MRFVRQRVGLMVWAFVALLVLLVPLWRLRAQRQCKSPVVDILLSPEVLRFQVVSPAGGFGLSQSEEQQAARRFRGDVAAQLSRLNEAELTRQINTLEESISSVPVSNAKELAQAQAKLRQLRPHLWKLSGDYFARYDELERRFPNSNEVRAQRLRDTMAGALPLDEGLPPRPASPSAPDLTLRFESSLSPTGREAAIRSAREGARREPDNAFFRWMEAILEFSQNRPDAALVALEAAGRCSDFRDYSLQSVALRLATLRRLRATGWEDDFTEYALSPFPHFAKMRSATRAGVEQIRLARHRGDEARAFRFGAALSRAGALVARSDKNTLISSAVGEATCAIAWRGAVEGVPGAPQVPDATLKDAKRQGAAYENYARQNVAFFAAMARARGQNDLARQVETTFASFDMPKLAAESFSNPDAIPAHIERLHGAYWLGSQLLRLSLVGAVLWCLSWALTRRRSETVARSRAQMLVPAMFCAGITGAILVAGASSSSLKWFFSLGGEEPVSNRFSVAEFLRAGWPLVLAVLWTTLVLASALWACRRKSARLEPKFNLRHIARGFGWSVFVVCVLIVFGFSVGSAPSGSGSDLIFYCALLVVAMVALVASGLGVWQNKGQKRAFAACLAGAFWTGIAGQFASSGTGDVPFYAMIAGGIAALLAVSALILALKIWKINFAGARNFAWEVTARARVAAGIIALLSALGYFGIALWTIPVEHRARALMDRQLRIGEVALLREQLRESR